MAAWTVRGDMDSTWRHRQCVAASAVRGGYLALLRSSGAHHRAVRQAHLGPRVLDLVDHVRIVPVLADEHDGHVRPIPGVQAHEAKDVHDHPLVDRLLLAARGAVDHGEAGSGQNLLLRGVYVPFLGLFFAVEVAVFRVQGEPEHGPQPGVDGLGDRRGVVWGQLEVLVVPKDTHKGLRVDLGWKWERGTDELGVAYNRIHAEKGRDVLYQPVALARTWCYLGLSRQLLEHRQQLHGSLELG